MIDATYAILPASCATLSSSCSTLPRPKMTPRENTKIQHDGLGRGFRAPAFTPPAPRRPAGLHRHGRQTVSV